MKLKEWVGGMEMENFFDLGSYAVLTFELLIDLAFHRKHNGLKRVPCSTNLGLLYILELCFIFLYGMFILLIPPIQLYFF